MVSGGVTYPLLQLRVLRHRLRLEGPLGADRQWVTSEGTTVYISYHDAGNSTLVHVQRSDDDGLTWTKVGDPIEPGVGDAQEFAAPSMGSASNSASIIAGLVLRRQDLAGERRSRTQDLGFGIQMIQQHRWP